MVEVKVWICEQKCLHKDLTEDQTQNLPDESPVMVIMGRVQKWKR